MKHNIPDTVTLAERIGQKLLHRRTPCHNDLALLDQPLCFQLIGQHLTVRLIAHIRVRIIIQKSLQQSLHPLDTHIRQSFGSKQPLQSRWKSHIPALQIDQDRRKICRIVQKQIITALSIQSLVRPDIGKQLFIPHQILHHCIAALRELANLLFLRFRRIVKIHIVLMWAKTPLLDQLWDRDLLIDLTTHIHIACPHRRC